MTPRAAALRFSVVGPGRLGSELAGALVAAGHRCAAVAARSRASARRALAAAGLAELPVAALDEAVAATELVILAVPDDALSPLAADLAALDRVWTGRTVLHTSGCLDHTILAPVARRGAATGSLHPMRAAARATAATHPFAGVTFGVEGDRTAVHVADRLARSLGGTPLRLAPGSKALYHLAAVMAANDLAALVDLAARGLEEAGLPRAEALRALVALARTSLDAIERSGLPAGLTGPVARGDAETLRRHAPALGRLPAGAADVHRLLALHCLELARAAGLLPSRAAAVRRALDEER